MDIEEKYGEDATVEEICRAVIREYQDGDPDAEYEEERELTFNLIWHENRQPYKEEASNFLDEEYSLINEHDIDKVLQFFKEYDLWQIPWKWCKFVCVTRSAVFAVQTIYLG